MFCFQPYTSAPKISEVGQISIYEMARDSYPTGPSSQHQCILNGRHPVNLNCLLKVYLPYTSKENMHLFCDDDDDDGDENDYDDHFHYLFL